MGAGASSSDDARERERRHFAMSRPQRFNPGDPSFAPVRTFVKSEMAAKECLYFHLVNTPPLLDNANASLKRCIELGMHPEFDLRKSSCKAVGKPARGQLVAVLPTTLRATCALLNAPMATKLICHGSPSGPEPKLGTVLHTALRFAKGADDARVLDLVRAVLMLRPTDVEADCRDPAVRDHAWLVDAAPSDAVNNTLLHIACFKGLRKTAAYLAQPRDAATGRGGGVDVAAENEWAETALDVSLCVVYVPLL